MGQVPATSSSLRAIECRDAAKYRSRPITWSAVHDAAMGPVPRVPERVPFGGAIFFAYSSNSASRKYRLLAGGGTSPFLCKSALTEPPHGTPKPHTAGGTCHPEPAR